MRNPKFLFSAGLLALCCALLVWRWVSGWGLVTLDVTKAPLASVIKSVERQGGVKISTNADPATPVTILLKRAPVCEAIDTLAVRVDGDARLAYIAAPDTKQITDVLAAFSAGTNPGGWSVQGAGFGGGGGPMIGGDTAVDPRLIEWNVSDVTDRSLQAVFQQGAQKTGALFAAPQAWNPVLGKLPPAGKTGKVTSSLVQTAKGRMSELFLITVRSRREDGPRGDDTVLSPQRGNRQGMNPEWMAERIKAQIAQLPAEERAAAQGEFDEMRAFWDSVRNLPEEERRAKMEEQMSKPEVQEKMDERMAARDAKRSPEQREQRFRRYLERKERTKTTPAKS